MSSTGSTPKSNTLFQRVVLAVGAIGTLLGVMTVIIVYRVMSGFHDDLMRRPDAAHDPMLLEAVARESNVMLLTLAAIVLAAAFNITAGFLVLRRTPLERAG